MEVAPTSVTGTSRPCRRRRIRFAFKTRADRVSAAGRPSVGVETQTADGVLTGREDRTRGHDGDTFFLVRPDAFPPSPPVSSPRVSITTTTIISHQSPVRGYVNGNAIYGRRAAVRFVFLGAGSPERVQLPRRCRGLRVCVAAVVISKSDLLLLLSLVLLFLPLAAER